MNVYVIGGGASGLMAAIVAVRRGCSVTILEHKDKIGKKILATGNGKCNYTNRKQTIDCYRGQDQEFAMRVYNQFNVDQTIQFFEELGIYPKERNGYVYPNSGQAQSVTDVLSLECKHLGVTIYLNTHVTKISKTKKGYQVTTNEKTYYADRCIIATGGCASSKLGSDGSGYQLMKDLGHTVLKPLPALVQLKSNAKCLKTLSGVRTDAAVRVLVNQKEVAREQGEILFAAYGLSGIPVMQLSRFAAYYLEQKKDVTFVIDLLPDFSNQQVQEELTRRWKRAEKKTAEEMLIGWLNHKLNYVLLKESGIDPVSKASSISPDQLKKLGKVMKEFAFKITDTNGFDNAQTCVGGVPTKEVDAGTLESKIHKGLYIVGELLDVDGTCGGYNLQWAWSSGMVAGTAASSTGKASSKK